MKLGEDPREDDIGWKGRTIDKVDIKVSITTDQGTFDVTNLVEESAWCEMTDSLFETFSQILGRQVVGKEESK